MTRAVGSTDRAVEARRRRVQRYLVDGYRPEDIAEMLGVHRATVYRDAAAIQADNQAGLRGMDADALAAELRERYLDRRRRLAGLRAENDGDVRVQLAVAEQEAAEDERFVRLMQTLGLVYQAPLEVRFEQRLVRVVESMTPEEVALVREMDDRQYAAWLRLKGVLQDERQPVLRLMPGA